MKIVQNDCNCCGKTRRHRKPRWAGCLGFNIPACPKIITPSNNVIAPSPSHQSKRMTNAKIIKYAANNSTGRWRRVNWKRFQLQQQTSEYQTRIMAPSTNNNSGFVIRNGKVINVPSSQENPCGYFTVDPSKKEMEDTIVSNCCKTPNTSLTWGDIKVMTPAMINSRLGIDPQQNFSCQNINANTNSQEGVNTFGVESNAALPASSCERVPLYEPRVC